MKRFLLICAAFALAFEGHASQLAFLVLNTANLGGGKLPPGWLIKVNHGRPDVSLVSEAEGPAVRLKSANSSFALERGVDVDPAELPFLTWRWKVARVPQGGDFRHAGTDDQAAQVLLAFADRRILTYIWDTSAPKGTAQSASSIPLVRIFAVVCQSGAADANRWLPETHNVAADYERAYGRPAPHVKGLRLQINSQHTGTDAESYFGEVAFRGSPQ